MQTFLQALKWFLISIGMTTTLAYIAALAGFIETMKAITIVGMALSVVVAILSTATSPKKPDNTI